MVKSSPVIDFLRLYEVGTYMHFHAHRGDGTTSEAARRLFYRLVEAGHLRSAPLGVNRQRYHTLADAKIEPQRLPIAYAITAYCTGSGNPRIDKARLRADYHWLWHRADYCLVGDAPCLLVVDQGSDGKHISRKLRKIVCRMFASHGFRKSVDDGRFQARVITGTAPKAAYLCGYFARNPLNFPVRAAVVEEFEQLMLRRVR